MKRAIQIAIALAVVAGVALGASRVISSRKADAAAQQAAAPAAKAAPAIELGPSDVVSARNVDLAQGLPISGSLKAVNSALVKARIAGELRALEVREGDFVKAGQVIARVDASDAQARLRQAQEQADAAKTQIEIAQRQWDNNKALVDQGFISKTALDTSWNNFVAAQANHKAALAAVDLSRKAVDDAVLVAPISGQVSQRLAQNGERVAVDARVVEIVDIRDLELEAAIAAADSVGVRVGQTAELRIEGAARPVSARVTRINPSAQAGSRAVLVYLKLQDVAGLRQGLFAQGTLGTSSLRTVAVPLSSLRTDKPEPYVQVVEQGVVKHLRVTPGARGEADGQIVVALDLPEGTRVIAGSAGSLREGTLVKSAGGAH